MAQRALRRQQRDRRGGVRRRGRGPDGDPLADRLTRNDLARPGVRVLNRGGIANPDVLLVPGPDGPVVVKDYAPRAGWVRRLAAPGLIAHEIAMLRRVDGVAGVPGFRGRIDRLAFAMDYIDGRPLERKLHAHALAPVFFEKIQRILDALAERGVAYFDLSSPSNVLRTAAGEPAIVDFGSAYPLRLPRIVRRRVEERALAKLRARFEGDRPLDAPGRGTTADGNLKLSQMRLAFRDRGVATDPLPALLLHDVGQTSAVFSEALDRAAASGRRAIAVDLPGSGGSRREAGDLAPRAVARHLVELLDALRIERVDVAGLGWGASIGAALVRLAPDRVRTSLALEAPASFAALWSEVGGDVALLRERLGQLLPAGIEADVEAALRAERDAVFDATLVGACRAEPRGDPGGTARSIGEIWVALG